MAAVWGLRKLADPAALARLAAWHASGACRQAAGLPSLAAWAAHQHGWQPARSYGSSAEGGSGDAGASSSSSTGASSSSSSSSSGYARPAAGSAGASTVNRREADKFAALAGQWWDPSGPFAPLHAMNPVRCRFLRAALCDTFGRDASARAPLAGLRLLDVGCGGGLLAESLARMGAHVTGVDVNEGGLATAAAHASLDPELAGRLEYRAGTAEALAAEGAVFDAVIASEVIEHVASLPAFCAALCALARPGGGVAVSTLNRTPRSYALAIVAAERLLRWVPPGTHDWSRFVTPEELAMQMEESTGSSGTGGGSSEGSSSEGGDGGGSQASSSSGGGLRLQLLAGMEYNPLTGAWALGRDTGVNYIAWFAKGGS